MPGQGIAHMRMMPQTTARHIKYMAQESTWGLCEGRGTEIWRRRAPPGGGGGLRCGMPGRHLCCLPLLRRVRRIQPFHVVAAAIAHLVACGRGRRGWVRPLLLSVHLLARGA